MPHQATHQAPATSNTAWGFFGTMEQQADAAWPMALAAIADATGCTADEVAMFLDSSHGRHFADQVTGAQQGGLGLQAAMHAATATWMGWKIGRCMAREHGIPQGMPYLTGWVLNVNINAEMAAG